MLYQLSYAEAGLQIKSALFQAWGCSSNGRALAQHARGTGIDTLHLHFFLGQVVWDGSTLRAFGRADVWALSSVEERPFRIREVEGSNPSVSTL